MSSVSLPNTGQPNNYSGNPAHTSAEAHTKHGAVLPITPERTRDSDVGRLFYGYSNCFLCRVRRDLRRRHTGAKIISFCLISVYKKFKGAKYLKLSIPNYH